MLITIGAYIKGLIEIQDHNYSKSIGFIFKNMNLTVGLKIFL